MADDLEQLMGTSSGEAPSAAFIDSLRAQIVTETATAVTPTELGADTDGVAALDLLAREENGMDTKGWIIGALVAAALAVVIGFAVVLINDYEPSLITDNPPTTTTEAPSTTTTTTPTTTAVPASTIPEVSEQAITTVEGFLNASDEDGLRSFLTEAAFEGNDEPGFGAQADDWLVLRQIVGVEAEVLSCVPAASETSITCSLSLTSKIIETLGEEPIETGITFNVEDGLITAWPAMSTANFNQTRTLATAAGFRDDWQAACPDRVTAECAEFVMENLAAWIAAAPTE